MLDDTIVAIATALGEGSIGVIRMSGPDAITIGKKVFRPKYNKEWYQKDNYKIIYGHVINPETGEIIDEVLLSIMRGPKSFTAEDVIEISCHGGIIPLRKVLEVILRNGARHAEPGEFSKRSFLNGRLDLAQAESIIDIIRAKTDAGAKIAVNQLGGKLSEKVNGLQHKVLGLLAKIEAIIDFPEDDIPEENLLGISKECNSLIKEIEHLLAYADTGKIYREGLKTVIVGKPNVGKSSLLNALLHEQRAIVTDIPGTTRDVIEEILSIKGVPLKIIDTAGLRETQDLVEKIGVEKSRELLNQADIVLFVLDATTGISDEDRKVIDLIKDKKVLILINKIDITKNKIDSHEIRQLINFSEIIEISAQKEIGLDKLEETIFNMVVEGKITTTDSIFVSNSRHKHALERAMQHLLEASKGLQEYVPADLVSIDLKSSWEILGEITGNSVTEDLIDRIFSDFCIGK
ncbi:tRNA modification GTPase trmE [Desulforamulus reducens MI-1]|uniref:tRNA modification GTPase MnmE n=1 Tax=Desulforamulus reducens (strain ATCC BAA-1160 / DSM 100696 / MI-1) TaxID=349161 RepID=MNME_DESRM|nr:tRNA uridine-5-carboxymethylaminomethyl(34) synthesis GTPase MnmE [Desulforamulus reducens]A4J9S1.1 RecName: Full=tRNA modification GTPase MnmE [Desulforamulus reducens MI-1]ABO51824.1 tRNA modification GTPase trmE [Desulforamulus reducens MI-1]